MIGPDSKVELLHNPLLTRALPLEGEGTDCVLCQDQDLLDVHSNETIECTLLIWPVLVALQLEEGEK